MRVLWLVRTSMRLTSRVHFLDIMHAAYVIGMSSCNSLYFSHVHKNSCVLI